MHDQSLMRIIRNDLDNLFTRIEALPPHPRLTRAATHVMEAADCIDKARAEMHEPETVAIDGPLAYEPMASSDGGVELKMNFVSLDRKQNDCDARWCKSKADWRATSGMGRVGHYCDAHIGESWELHGVNDWDAHFQNQRDTNDPNIN